MLRIPQIHFFPLTALTAQTAQTEEFMFQNVAYWQTIDRTGVSLMTLNVRKSQIIDFLLQSVQKTNNFFLISAVASKKWSNQKIKHSLLC